MSQTYTNILVISGFDTHNFFQQNSTVTEKLSLSKIIPKPFGMNEYGESKAWCIDNWSCHEDIDGASYKNMTISDDRTFLIYVFSTEGNYPEKWLLKVSLNYPKSTFAIEYIEDKSKLAGRLIMNNGMVISNTDFSDKNKYMAFKNEFLKKMTMFAFNPKYHSH